MFSCTGSLVSVGILNSYNRNCFIYYTLCKFKYRTVNWLFTIILQYPNCVVLGACGRQCEFSGAIKEVNRIWCVPHPMDIVRGDSFAKIETLMFHNLKFKSSILNQQGFIVYSNSLDHSPQVYPQNLWIRTIIIYLEMYM